jgi:hypothetical protein
VFLDFCAQCLARCLAFLSGNVTISIRIPFLAPLAGTVSAVSSGCLPFFFVQQSIVIQIKFGQKLRQVAIAEDLISAGPVRSLGFVTFIPIFRFFRTLWSLRSVPVVVILRPLGKFGPIGEVGPIRAFRSLGFVTFITIFRVFRTLWSLRPVPVVVILRPLGEVWPLRLVPVIVILRPLGLVPVVVIFRPSREVRPLRLVPVVVIFRPLQEVWSIRAIRKLWRAMVPLPLICRCQSSRYNNGGKKVYVFSQLHEFSVLGV